MTDHDLLKRVGTAIFHGLNALLLCLLVSCLSDSFIHGFVCLLVRSFVLSFVCSLVRSFVLSSRSFARSSFVLLLLLLLSLLLL